MKRRTTIVAVLLPATLLVGCGSNSPAPGPSASTAAPSPSAAASPAGCVPAFTANALPDTMGAVGGQLGMQSATAGVQPGYDRVVFRLGGSGQPGWRVAYVPATTSDGSGNAVTVSGPSYLQVVIKDVGVPGDTGVPDPTVKRFSPSGTTVVREVVLDTVFEGQYTAFIGVSATLPFRVFRLSSPARVVVDVRHC